MIDAVRNQGKKLDILECGLGGWDEYRLQAVNHEAVKYVYQETSQEAVGLTPSRPVGRALTFTGQGSFFSDQKKMHSDLFQWQTFLIPSSWGIPWNTILSPKEANCNSANQIQSSDPWIPTEYLLNTYWIPTEYLLYDLICDRHCDNHGTANCNCWPASSHYRVADSKSQGRTRLLRERGSNEGWY